MNLHLFVPDIFWPDGSQTDIYQHLKLPALETILAKSNRFEVGGEVLESWLCKIFNVNKQQDWPIASILLQREKNRIEVGESYWLRADPVHLRVENNHILLGDNQILNISLKEATSFADSINEFFSDEGVTLLPLHSDRWYVKCDETPELQTFLLSQVVGKNINDLLSRGKEGAIWNSRINEIQMFLHEHPLNRNREIQGELPVNSIWIWGGGVRPSEVRTSYTGIWGNHVLVHALAEMGKVMCHDLPENADEVLNHSGNSGEQLIVLDNLQKYACYRDAYNWRNELMKMERDWFDPLFQALKKRQIQQLKLTIVNESSTKDFVLTPGSLWKFWAAVRPLGTYS
ncbi:hypothetical protein [Nitrosomonas europaea]|uniref:hypothetical protein n=1 Tax=Nitrosomonas europaea TaxID=915 RepID=UPI00079872FC|nr:hypothetical protein [Nitrosomonas europaea]KXK45641.1 MAG: 2,3-bisphosphoglycerate-independent phosphoglycerate mutase [Nitrosomonas europaea]QOJ08825.1 MAG: hypothetical protein HRU73_04615 [Nitrosomonas sp. H1_AOB3]